MRYGVILDYGEDIEPRRFILLATATDRQDALEEAEAFVLGCEGIGLPNRDEVSNVRQEQDGELWLLDRPNGVTARVMVTVA